MDADNAQDAKIVIDGIRKGFAKDGRTLQVIDGLSLDVKDGEFVAIVGPSGCGKSTLMKVIVEAAPEPGLDRLRWRLHETIMTIETTIKETGARG